MNALSSRKGLLSRLGHILQDVICMLNRLSWLQVVFVKTQCYKYRFGARFGLSIGMEYFSTDLFRRTVSECFGVTLFYNKKKIINK